MDFKSWFSTSSGQKVLAAIEDQEGFTQEEANAIFAGEVASPELREFLVQCLKDYYIDDAEESALLQLGLSEKDLVEITGEDCQAPLQHRIDWLNSVTSGWRWGGPAFDDLIYSKEKEVLEKFWKRIQDNASQKKSSPQQDTSSSEKLLLFHYNTALKAAMALENDPLVALNILAAECDCPITANILKEGKEQKYGCWDRHLLWPRLRNYFGQIWRDFSEADPQKRPVVDEELKALEESLKRFFPHLPPSYLLEKVEILTRHARWNNDLELNKKAGDVAMSPISRKNYFQYALANLMVADSLCEILEKGVSPSCNPSHAELKSVYTTRPNGSPERIFKGGETITLKVVLWNSSASRAFVDWDEIQITPDLKIKRKTKGKRMEVPPQGHAIAEYEFAMPKNSGVVKLEVHLGNDHPISWKIAGDPYGVPDWIRTAQAVYLDSEKEEIFEDSESWRPLFQQLAENGIDIVFAGLEYYNWSPIGGTVDVPFNYWPPAGGDYEEWDGHYTSPPDSLVDAQTGTDAEKFAKARDKIRGFVRLAHDEGLKVMAYMDPTMIFSPTEKLLLFGDDSRAFPKSEDPEFVRYCGGQPKRTTFQEDPLVMPVSPSDIGVVPSFGNAGEKISIPITDAQLIFSDDPAADHPNWDSSFDFVEYITRQTRWLTDPRGYDFDVIFADDAGRMLGKVGNDPVTCRLHWSEQCLYGVPPQDSTYFQGCEAGDEEKDNYANLLGNMRAAIKEGRPDKVLINQPYYVTWDSLVPASDVLSTDFFDAASEAFARWAYENYERSLKPQRLDWNPNSAPIQNILKKTVGTSGNEDLQEDLFRIIAYGWANRVPFWYGFSSLIPITRDGPEDPKLFQYSKWFAEYGKTGIVSELLHHSKLHSTHNNAGLPLDQTGEVFLLKGGEVYYTLYEMPEGGNEWIRWLHVVNERHPVKLSYTPLKCASDWHRNVSESAEEFEFAVRIPVGSRVKKIEMHTPDRLEAGGFDFEEGNGFVKIKVPVWIYSLVKIDLEPI